MLTRRGVLVEDIGQTYLPEPDDDGDEARILRPLQGCRRRLSHTALPLGPVRGRRW